ncbi:MAG TPA: PaaX family transcriptional regulator C-terminal domain-containing protein [Streptosporangiaceae bacterium]|nr:PaaX family transcriptional regulator C-terminal domain-containing protein [Streptosporangiaceae bacterium]
MASIKVPPIKAASITVPVDHGRLASDTRCVNARSALFDLYGDHLLTRGEQAPVAALVRLLAPAAISPPAVRTAVSRMARQGWLVPVRLAGGPGYRLTPRAVERLAQAAERIYRRESPHWDGRWHVVVTDRITERSKRDRVKSALGYLGYANLDGCTWISPRPSVELDQVIAAEQVRAERFNASYDGDQRGLAARAWDLDGLAHAYKRWITRAHEIILRGGEDRTDDVNFAVRSELVHEWRKFLFIDPGLPAELLPSGWPGADAADLFHTEADRLLPSAGRFVDWALAASNGRRSATQASG